MKAHGGYAPPQLHRREEAEAWTTPGIRGFRTLFGAMEPGDAFRGYGLDGDAARARTCRLLERLAARMQRPYAWPQAAAAGVAPEDNPGIPSGYTYLAQLAAHDLSFLGSTVSSIDDALLDQRNLRTVVLNLDTMYGAGPLDRPGAYSLPPDRRGPRTKLRLGRARLRATESTSGPANGPLRDLPRVGCPHLDAGSEAAGLTDVLIPDPRNDAHALVGQMLVAFHLLHNAVIDALTRHFGPSGAPLSAERAFFLARSVVVMAFRSVVEHDLLRRLLNPAVHRYYSEGGRLLDPDGSNRMPVEFSHAAFRIGHAMIRPSYQLNDEARFGLREVLSTNSSDLPGSMPLSANWLVRWSKFFEIDGAAPANLARRLSPYALPTLCDGTLVGLDSGAQAGGLPMRDLMRGASTFMRSVDSLIAHVPARFKRDVPLLADAEHRREAIRDWLQEGGDAFSAEDCEVLGRDPPLVFFLLFEAARTEDGLRLGRLGSIILGEVFFRALRTEEADAGVRDAAAFVFPGGVPTTMPALLAHIAAQPAVAGQTVAFL